MKYNAFMKTSERLNLSERQNNIIKVLTSVYEKPEIQTADIKKATGLSISTISRVLGELKQKELIEISGKEKIRKGRFPQILKFNFGCGHILHIDIKPTVLYGCISDLSGVIIKKLQKRIKIAELSFERILLEIKTFYEELSEKRKVLAAGLTIPGIADENKRVISRIPDIPALGGIDLFNEAEQMLGVPVIINNIPGITAIGERKAYYKNCDNFVYLSVMQSVGIGAGIISNGAIIKGKDFIAGEVGDFYFDRKSFSNTPKQSIGRLEQYAGLSSLYKRAEELMKSGGAKKLAAALKKHELKQPTPHLIEQSIVDGDKDLEEKYLDVIRAWVILIIDIVLLLNPEEIVIGGAINTENTYTRDVINDILEKELFVDQKIKLAKSGEDAVYIGGLDMLRSFVFERILINKAIDN